MADFAIVQGAARTTTGTQDFTVAGFGTPKGAIFYFSLGTANGTKVDGAGFGMGFTDGTRDRSLAISDQDDVGTTVARRKMSATACVTILGNTGTLIGEATFSAWITDGVRINWPTTVPASAHMINCLLIGGTGVAAVRVDTATISQPAGTPLDVTAPNFPPDVLFTLGTDGNNDTTITNGAQLDIGLAIRTGAAQRSVHWNSSNAQVGSTSSSLTASTTKVFREITNVYDVTVSGWDSQGFTMTGGGTFGSNLTLYYLCFQLTSPLRASIVNYDSPTASGAFSITGAGFKPQLMIQGLSARVNNDVLEQNADGRQEVIGMSMLTAAKYCVSSIWSDYGVATSNTESYTDQAVMVGIRKDVALFQEENFVAFTTDGVSATAATFNATARKRVALFIEDAPSTPADQLKLEIRAAP